jgi:hypothetical protein
MLLVERVNFMHPITEQPGNDAACARTEDQIKHSQIGCPTIASISFSTPNV